VILRIKDCPEFQNEPAIKVMLYQGVPMTSKLEIVVEKMWNLALIR